MLVPLFFLPLGFHVRNAIGAAERGEDHGGRGGRVGFEGPARGNGVVVARSRVVGGRGGEVAAEVGE